MASYKAMKGMTSSDASRIPPIASRPVPDDEPAAALGGPWDSLPVGVIEEISAQCRGWEWLRLRLVCKYWRDALSVRVRTMKMYPGQFPSPGTVSATADQMLRVFPRVDSVTVWSDANNYVTDGDEAPAPSWEMANGSSKNEKIHALLAAVGARPTCPAPYRSARQASHWLSSISHTRSNAEMGVGTPPVNVVSGPPGGLGDLRLDLVCRPSVVPINVALDLSNLTAPELATTPHEQPLHCLSRYWQGNVDALCATVGRALRTTDIAPKLTSLELNLVMCPTTPVNLAPLTALTELRLVSPSSVRGMVTLHGLDVPSSVKQLSLQARLELRSVELAEVLSTLPLLTHLELEHDTASVYGATAPILATCTRLQVLRLQNVVLSSVRHLSILTHLKEVTLTVEPGHGDYARHLWPTLAGLPRLTCINLNAWSDTASPQEGEERVLMPVTLPDPADITPDLDSCAGSLRSASRRTPGRPPPLHHARGQTLPWGVAPARPTAPVVSDLQGPPLRDLTRLTSLSVYVKGRVNLQSVGLLTGLQELTLSFQAPPPPPEHAPEPGPATEAQAAVEDSDGEREALERQDDGGWDSEDETDITVWGFNGTQTVWGNPSVVHPALEHLHVLSTTLEDFLRCRHDQAVHSSTNPDAGPSSARPPPPSTAQLPARLWFDPHAVRTRPMAAHGALTPRALLCAVADAIPTHHMPPCLTASPGAAPPPSSTPGSAPAAGPVEEGAACALPGTSDGQTALGSTVAGPSNPVSPVRQASTAQPARSHTPRDAALQAPEDAGAAARVDAPEPDAPVTSGPAAAPHPFRAPSPAPYSSPGAQLPRVQLPGWLTTALQPPPELQGSHASPGSLRALLAYARQIATELVSAVERSPGSKATAGAGTGAVPGGTGGPVSRDHPAAPRESPAKPDTVAQGVSAPGCGPRVHPPGEPRGAVPVPNEPAVLDLTDAQYCRALHEELEQQYNQYIVPLTIPMLVEMNMHLMAGRPLREYRTPFSWPAEWDLLSTVLGQVRHARDPHRPVDNTTWMPQLNVSPDGRMCWCARPLPALPPDLRRACMAAIRGASGLVRQQVAALLWALYPRLREFRPPGAARMQRVVLPCGAHVAYHVPPHFQQCLTANGCPRCGAHRRAPQPPQVPPSPAPESDPSTPTHDAPGAADSHAPPNMADVVAQVLPEVMAPGALQDALLAALQQAAAPLHGSPVASPAPAPAQQHAQHDVAVGPSPCLWRRLLRTICAIEKVWKLPPLPLVGLPGLLPPLQLLAAYLGHTRYYWPRHGHVAAQHQLAQQSPSRPLGDSKQRELEVRRAVMEEQRKHLGWNGQWPPLPQVVCVPVGPHRRALSVLGPSFSTPGGCAHASGGPERTDGAGQTAPEGVDSAAGAAVASSTPELSAETRDGSSQDAALAAKVIGGDAQGDAVHEGAAQGGAHSSGRQEMRTTVDDGTWASHGQPLDLWAWRDAMGQLTDLSLLYMDWQRAVLLPPLSAWLSGAASRGNDGRSAAAGDAALACGGGTPTPRAAPGGAGPCSSLAALYRLSQLVVMHVFDANGSTPLRQRMLPHVGSWWPVLREVYIQGDVRVCDLGDLQLPNLLLLDLYNTGPVPFTVELDRLPPKVKILGFQNVHVVGAHRAGQLSRMLESVSLHTTVHWERFLNGGLDTCQWLGQHCPALQTLTLELPITDLVVATVQRRSPLLALKQSPCLTSLELLFASSEDTSIEMPPGMLDPSIISHLSDMTRLERLEIWTAYGTDWAPGCDFTSLTRLTRLRHLNMEVLPPHVCFGLRKALCEAIPSARVRVVVDNEPTDPMFEGAAEGFMNFVPLFQAGPEAAAVAAAMHGYHVGGGPPFPWDAPGDTGAAGQPGLGALPQLYGLGEDGSEQGEESLGSDE